MTEFKNPSQTFCILPWIHLATLTDGSTTLCCVAENESKLNLNQVSPEEVWNSKYWKNARLAMLNGEQLRACTRCYEEEKHGYRSHRVVENQEWVRRLGADTVQGIVTRTGMDGSLDSSFISIDLRLGNTCNLQCVMCQPKESSKWQAAANKLSETLKDRNLASEWSWKGRIQVEKYEWYRNPAFWENMRELLPHFQEIIIAGGEPMLIAEQAEFIRYCAESGAAHNIRLRYHTNATVLPEELIPHWSKFKIVEILLSIDGLGDVNHYVRYPADWTRIERNLEIYDSLPDNIQLMVLCTVHALNFWHVPDLIRYLHARQFKKSKTGTGLRRFFHPGIVQWPTYLSPTVLPAEMKKEISLRVQKLQQDLDIHFDKLEGVVNLMNSRDDTHLLPRLEEYCLGLDRVRGTNFATTFPELRSHINPGNSTR